MRRKLWSIVVLVSLLVLVVGVGGCERAKPAPTPTKGSPSAVATGTTPRSTGTVPLGTPGTSPEPEASGTVEPPPGATATPVLPEPTTAPPIPTTAPSAGVQHVVASGETVETIASQYGVTAAEIIAANNLTDPDLIRVGDVLIIPGVTTPASQEGVHVVREGETLGYIASLYGVTAEAIAAANGIVNENLISVGQRLIIPGGSTSQTGGQTYVVQEGDTLTTIAAAFGTTEQAIVSANSLANANMIYVGQSLLIP